MLKKFALVSFSILCLSLAYLAGTTTRTHAQSGGLFVSVAGGGNTNEAHALTASGDLYLKVGDTWVFEGNFITETGGGPVNVLPDSWGAIKGKYK